MPRLRIRVFVLEPPVKTKHVPHPRTRGGAPKTARLFVLRVHDFHAYQALVCFFVLRGWRERLGRGRGGPILLPMGFFRFGLGLLVPAAAAETPVTRLAPGTLGAV